MRVVVGVILFSMLLACQQRDKAVEGLVIKETGALRAASQIKASAALAPPVLILSLPADQGGREAAVAGWRDDMNGRYRTDEWFNAAGAKEEARLKVKTKLLLKEHAKLEASLGAYADAIGGAEIGVEYKIR